MSLTSLIVYMAYQMGGWVDGGGAGPTFVFLSPAVKMYRMNTQLLDSGAVGRLENSNFRLKKEKKLNGLNM